MDTYEDRLHRLEKRLLAVEDELAIYKIIVAYGFAVDSGDADWTASLFAEDAVFDIDATTAHGRRAIQDMVLGERHRALLPNCAHTVGPVTVVVDGDRATAHGYSRLYLRNGEQIDLWRLSFNRWLLERRSMGWQIVQRSTRLLGDEETASLIASARTPS